MSKIENFLGHLTTEETPEVLRRCIQLSTADDAQQAIFEELSVSELEELAARLESDDRPGKTYGKLHPAKSLFLRVDVGTAKGDDGSEYELSSGGAYLPMVRSKKSGRYWSLSWDDALALAIRAGVDKEG